MTERRPTILVVDDEVTISDLIKTILETEEKYPVRTAANGQEALDFLQAGLIPDLILLDIKMPVMGGREFLGAIKNLNGLNRIPIVVMSASDGRSDYSEFPQVGGRLPKPFELDDLSKVIEKNIRIGPSSSLVAACIT